VHGDGPLVEHAQIIKVLYRLFAVAVFDDVDFAPVFQKMREIQNSRGAGRRFDVCERLRRTGVGRVAEESRSNERSVRQPARDEPVRPAILFYILRIVLRREFAKPGRPAAGRRSRRLLRLILENNTRRKKRRWFPKGSFGHGYSAP
jgi:hypothetical protein